MNNEHERTDAGRKDSAAYAAHDTEHDLLLAFQLCKDDFVHGSLWTVVPHA